MFSVVQGRANLEVPNNRKQTPLILAVSQGHAALIELLVTNGKFEKLFSYHMNGSQSEMNAGGSQRVMLSLCRQVLAFWPRMRMGTRVCTWH